MAEGRRALRALLGAPGLVVAPGAWDAVTARLVEQAGFPAVYMSGAATSLAAGYPDFGLLTATEMADNAGVLARAVVVPVIADADTGYGNELNVTRTVRDYEARGVAGIHIEDQAMPKRCGHLDGKEVVGREDFVSKIRAAVAARSDPDFVIIARTDARQPLGFDEAIARANAALAAGADAAFVEAVETVEELTAVPRLVAGPCLYNVVLGGKTPVVPMADAARYGYRIAILPGLLMRAAVAAMDEALAAFHASGTPPEAKPGALIKSFNRFGAEEWRALGERFKH